MKLRKKKGFTIIELVIVIAVIGILTAVLVPTFINLTNKANEAADDSLVKNLNTALKMEEQLIGNKKNETLQDAVDDLEAEGYILENLISKSGKDLLWNQEKNEFTLNTDSELKDANYWQIVEKMPETQRFSYYAGKNFQDTSVNPEYGFDVGGNTTVEAINYDRSDATIGQSVKIRTNGGTLTINAPKDEVAHFGQSDYVDIVAVKSSSYAERGTASLIKVAKGNISLNSDSTVGEIHLAKTGDVFTDIKVTLEAGAQLPELSRDPVGTSLASDVLVCEVSKAGASEFYWLEGNATIEDEKVFVSTDKEGVNKVAATAQNSTAVAIANAKVGETVTDKGEAVPSAATITPEQLVEKTAKGASKTFSEIDSREKLLAFRDAWNEGKLANNGTYNITADINISNEMWLPIGTFENPFNGTIKGNNHTIKGLSGDNTVVTEFFTTSSTQVYGAVYGFIAVAGNGNTTVKDLVFTDVNINLPSLGNCVGTVIGYAPMESDFGSETNDYKDSQQGKYINQFDGKWWKKDLTELGKYDGKYYTGKANAIGHGNQSATDIVIQNITVSGSKFSVKDSAGAIMGKAYNPGHLEVTGCTTDIKVESNGRGAGLVGYASQPTSINIRNNTIKQDVYAVSTAVDKVALFTNIGKDFVYDNNTTTGMKAYYNGVEQQDYYSLVYTYDEEGNATSVTITNDPTKALFNSKHCGLLGSIYDGTLVGTTENPFTFIFDNQMDLYDGTIVNNLIATNITKAGSGKYVYTHGTVTFNGGHVSRLYQNDESGHINFKGGDFDEIGQKNGATYTVTGGSFYKYPQLVESVPGRTTETGSSSGPIGTDYYVLRHFLFIEDGYNRYDYIIFSVNEGWTNNSKVVGGYTVTRSGEPGNYTYVETPLSE